MVVLVTVNGYQRNDQGATSAATPQRLELTMVEQGGKWLATNLSSIGIQSATTPRTRRRVYTGRGCCCAARATDRWSPHARAVRAQVDEPHGEAPSAAAAPQARLDKPRPAPAPPDTEYDEPARPQPATGVRSLPLAWFPAAVVLAVAAVVLTGLIGVYSYRGYWAKPGSATVSTKQQETVLAAAKTCFARLNTYDYRTLDQDLAAGPGRDHRNLHHELQGRDCWFDSPVRVHAQSSSGGSSQQGWDLDHQQRR